MARLRRDELHAHGTARAARARRPAALATADEGPPPAPSRGNLYRAGGVVEPPTRPLDEGVVDDRGAQRDLRHLAEGRRVDGAEAPRLGEPRARQRIGHVLGEDSREMAGGHLAEAAADGAARPGAGLDEAMMMPVEAHAPRRPGGDPPRTTDAPGHTIASNPPCGPRMRVLQTTASRGVKPGAARSRGAVRETRGRAPRSCRGRPRRSARASERPPGCRRPRRGLARRRRP